MPQPETMPTDAPRDDFVRDLLVEVFLARGAAHHGDLHEAAAEFRELCACLGVSTDENEALVRRTVDRLEERAGRARLRLVTNGTPPAA